MIVAIVPAAGLSRRMGRPKLALPLAGKTVLEWVLSALREGGCADVLVVVGPHVAQLVPLAERAGAAVLLLEQETPDMRATVEAGWRWWESRRSMSDEDAWLLVPADHPVLEGAIVARLLQERSRQPDRSLFIPVHESKRGHPALIGWKHVRAMRALPDGVGLNVYLRQHLDETVEVPVGSPGVLRDLDTPEDYADLLEGK